MHTNTFECLKVTDAQIKQMAKVGGLFKDFATSISDELPDGPDKTHILRQLRDCSMWANVTITRLPDGTPRE